MTHQSNKPENETLSDGGNVLLVWLALGPAIGMLAFMAMTPFYPLIASDLGVSVAALGQIITVTTLGSTVLALLAGPLADRYGHMRGLAVGVASTAISAGLIALSYGYMMLLVVGVVASIGQAIIRPAAQAIAGTRYQEHRRRRALSLVTAGLSGGGLIGFPVLTTIGGEYGWRWAFVLLASIAFVVTIALGHLARQDTPIERSGDVLSKELFNTYRSIMGNTVVVSLLVAALLRSAMIWGFYTYRAAFFIEQHRFTVEQAGFLITAAGVGLLAGSSIAGSKFAGKIASPIWLVSLTLSMGLIGWLVLGLTEINSGVATAGVVLFSLCLGMVAVPGRLLLLDASSRGIATTMTLNGAFSNLGIALGSGAGGILLATGGYHLVGVSLLSFGALSTTMVLLSSRQMQHAKAQEQ